MAVVLNMSAERRTVRLDLAPHGLQSRPATALLTSSDNSKVLPDGGFTLEPFSVYIGELR